VTATATALAPRRYSGRLPIALYPIALAAALVAELLVVSGVSPFGVVRSLVVAVLVAIAATVVGRLVLADRDRGGVAASLGILLLFAGADTRIMIVVGVGFAIIAFERLATHRNPVIRWWVVGRVLTALVAILALAIGIRAVQDGTAGVVAREVMSETPLAGSATQPVVAADHPDIYLILLDGFARPDVLEDVFDADGSEFVSRLTERGFTVSSRSRSNYARTALTLASLFNMRPFQEIDTLEPLLDANSSAPAGSLVREAIDESSSLDVLRSLGYELTSISSGYEGVALRNVDTWIDTGQINDFESVLLGRSFVSVVLRALAPDLVSSQHRARIDESMRALEEISSTSSDRPRFVFCHIPSPHAPWVYNGDGTPRTAVEYGSFHDDVPVPTGLT
jgi:hypothetical protein